MKKLAMIAAGVLWAAGAFAQSPCREEWRGYFVFGGQYIEDIQSGVRQMMLDYGLQPVGGVSSIKENDATPTLFVQALAFRHCIDDPRNPNEDSLTSDKLNAALVAAGLPAMVGKK